MDSTDRLIDSAVSQYAPSKNVKKRIFDRIMKQAGEAQNDEAEISIVYVSKDAKKLIRKIFSDNQRIFRKLYKMENEIFCDARI